MFLFFIGSTCLFLLCHHICWTTVGRLINFYVTALLMHARVENVIAGFFAI